MKNIYLFFIFFFIISCNSSFLANNDIKPVSCPPILFSSEHKIYISSSNTSISMDNIDYHGEINNATFEEECTLKNNIFVAELSILFIAKPFVNKIDSINIPFYIAILNQNNELQDMLYFSASGQFKKNPENNNLVESEIIKTINLQNKNIKSTSIIVIGYILDKKKEKILN